MDGTVVIPRSYTRLARNFFGARLCNMCAYNVGGGMLGVDAGVLERSGGRGAHDWLKLRTGGVFTRSFQLREQLA